MNVVGKNWILAAVVLLISSLTISYAAQAPAPSAAKSVEGMLLKVDAEMKTIDVRGPDDKEINFAYDEKTEVVGAQEGPQGLSLTLGTKVKVEFTEKAGINTASKIQVLPKEAAQRINFFV